MRGIAVIMAVLAMELVAGLPARADEVHFRNGDRLTGTIVRAADGKLVLRTEAAGEVTIDLARVRTFSTTAPVVVQLRDRQELTGPVAAGAEGIILAGPPGAESRALPIDQVAAINPPPVRWKGALSINAAMTTGNTEVQELGGKLEASRRGEHDRITAGAAYNHGRQRDPGTGDETVTLDNWFVLGKYDRFFTKRFYGFGALRVERDRIAELDLRVTPTVGVGHQWVESPTFNLASESGVAWVYEDYRADGDDDYMAARLAYRVDYTLVKPVRLFHDLEWLPRLDDPLDDFTLNANAGVRTTIVEGLFSEFRVELRYDAQPAPGSEEADLRYLLSVGWSF